jgi:glycosyltransferase involved in cell wall biosynthesis
MGFSMPSNEVVRVLFLHATWHHTSEYNVHRLLAEKADPHLVDCFFIWQTHTRDATKNRPASLSRENRNLYFDFGRDMSLKPKPAKWRRLFMMLYRFPFAFFFLSGKVWKIQPDIIYTSQQTYEVFLAKILSFFFRIPHFIHISYAVGDWLGKATVETIIRTPNLIACSEFVRQTALDEGVAPEQIETLLHGANVEEYAIERDPKWLRDEFSLPANAQIIITAARLDPDKGYMNLLHAFAKVYEVNPDVRLIACGEGTTGKGYEQRIKQLASDLNLDSVVVFTNFRDDLPQLFAGSDIFCLPTKQDALPLVFLGAMAAGLPVVGVWSGGVPEMVSHGETGLLSEPNNPDELADNLITLLNDKDLARKYGEKGRERAFRDFDPVKVSNDWTNLLFRRLSKDAGNH